MGKKGRFRVHILGGVHRSHCIRLCRRAGEARMTTKPGYKRTDVGVVPNDWVVAPLESFTSFISYGFTNPMPTSEGGIFMITAKDIFSGQI